MWWFACLLGTPVILLLALTPLLAAQEQATPPGAEVAQNPPPAMLQKEAAPPKDKNPKRFADIDDVTKDMGKLSGLFDIYRFDPSDKKRDPEKLLARIPAKLLGQDILFATSISRGAQAGFMWGDALIRFEVVGDQLKLVTPDLRYVHKNGAPVTEAVERTYTGGYIAAVPIKAMSPQGDVIIDLEALLKSDLAEVGRGRVRPDLSTWNTVKVFPDNVLIDVDLALSGGQGGSSVGVAYAFRRLPPLNAYKPRQADPRIGYFLTAQMDWSKGYNERETFDRYIHRWKLEKQDPSLELSPPKEPIVFIIEKSVPIQWRRWIKEGIEEWNRAYEKIGFTGAIVVQQQTETNEYADYDPEDARYNFLRWGVTGRGFAMGPSRVDPRTGQILDADIFFDDAFIRAWMYEFDLFAPSAAAESKGPGFTEWLRANPEFVPESIKQSWAEQDTDPEQTFWADLEGKLCAHGRSECCYAAGMQRELAMVQHALIATGSGPKKLPERLIGEAIREIVTHEVGHTLGLRHNFKASAWLSLDEIKRRRDETDLPSTASVMDYNPLLFFTGDNLENVRHFVSPCIGPYDEWAIAYGYAIPQGKSEDDMLKEIASRCTEPELQFATDEDSNWLYSPDPLVNTYDLSSNPMDFAQSRIDLCDELLKNITDWAIQKGEPRYYLTQAFTTVWYQRYSNLDYVARLVGGQYFYRDNQGDPDARPAFVLVEPKLQRAALKYLGKTLFQDQFFRVDPGLLNMLAPSRWSHWGSRAPNRIDYPIHGRISTMQTMGLLNLMAPPVLERIYDAELKATGDDKFTVAELLTTLNEQIWPQLGKAEDGTYTDTKPLISSIERNLQRAHLLILCSLGGASPGSTMSADVQSMVRLALRDLSEQMARALQSPKLDFASRAHLVESQSRIERTLAAPFQGR
jgi:hypothetical protein